MKSVLMHFDDEIKAKKQKSGLTWRALVITGLDFIENRKKENARILELEQEIIDLQRNIGKMQELLRQQS